MTKETIPRYYLVDGNVMEFSSKEDLEKWIQNYIDNNPGKGLALTDATKRVMVMLGNEVVIKTEVVAETQQVEVHKLKVELGEVRNV